MDNIERSRSMRRSVFGLIVLCFIAGITGLMHGFVFVSLFFLGVITLLCLEELIYSRKH